MISPLAFVNPEAKLGKDVIVHPFAYIDKDVEIGDNCEIMPYVSIVGGTRMGSNNKIYQGAIIGADPQDFRWNGKDKTLCIIGNNNKIRESVIINRGIKPDNSTQIGDDCFIMAETHIGHDTHIKGRSVLGNGVMIAGDCVIEECSILSSAAVVHCGSHIGRWSMVKGGCRISGNVPPFTIIAHNPAVYYGVNAYILRSHDFDEDTIDDIAKSYRHIYQCDTSLQNALKRISLDVKQSKERDEIINFIKESNMRIVGANEHSEYMD